MNQRRLGFLGWLMIIKAAITISLNIHLFSAAFFWELLLLLGQSPRVDFGGIHPIDGLLSILSGGLFVYTFWSFKKLLNTRFNFTKTDTLIKVLILINICVTTLLVLDGVIPPIEPVIKIIYVVVGPPILIVYGIIFIALSFALLDLQDNLFGLLNQLVLTGFIAGLGYATIIFGAMAILVSVIYYITLGIIIFKGRGNANPTPMIE